MSCLALVRFEFVLFRDRIEVFDDAPAERGVVAHIKEQAIKLLCGRRRMFIELESLVLEFETAVFFRDLLDWGSPLPGRNEAHHTMAVMPSRGILKKFPPNRSNRSQHDGPIEHFCVAG